MSQASDHDVGVRRETRGFLLFCLGLSLAACNTPPALPDLAISLPDAQPVIAFDPCQSLCLRPSDCEIAYPDDDLCPAGFRCSSRFTCSNLDGGIGD